MEFVSANPSVVRSIKQRVLLNAWLRALRKPQSLPAISDFRPDGIGDELADMMGFNVEGEVETARFLISPSVSSHQRMRSNLRTVSSSNRIRMNSAGFPATTA